MIAGLTPYPAMKDSGVPWLGEVPKHWDVQPLGRIGRLFKGNGSSKADEVPEGVPCVRYGDLYTRHEFFIRTTKAYLTPERAASYTKIRYGDVLFAASGETIEDIGRSAENLLDCEARCGGDVLLLRPTRPFSPGFLGYAADSPASRHQKACMGRGFTVVHIYAAELKDLALPFPSLPEQSAIVRFLDYADRRIRRQILAKQKLIKLLEEQKQALIHRAVTRGLPSTASGQATHLRLKPSGVEWLGDVPEHWEVKRLKRLARSRGKAFTDGDWIELPYITTNGVRLIQTGNVGRGEYREKGFRYISEATFEEFRCTEVVPNDVLICRLDGPVGRACLVPDLGCKAITSVDNTILKVNSATDPRFTVYCLSSSSWLDFLQSICRAGGGFRYRVARSTLGDLSVPVPPLAEQREVADHLDALLLSNRMAIGQASRAIDLLREYRIRLIADVVTGKLDVREAASRLPDEVEEPEMLAEVDASAEDNQVEDAAMGDHPEGGEE